MPPAPADERAAARVPPVPSRAGRRVCIVQQIVPRYRVPVFERLAAEPKLVLEVWSDEVRNKGSLAQVGGEGRFASRHTTYRRVGPILLQPSQLQAVRSGRFDVVILPWSAWSVHLAPALRLARRRGVGIILWGHGYSKRESPLRRRLRNRLLRHADAALLYNHRTADRLAADGFPRQRLFVAQNAIDQSPVQAARRHWLERPDDLRRFQDEHDLLDRPVVVFISRLEPDKRIDLLLHAFHNVVRAEPAARLIIIGSGSDDERLRRLARQLGLDSAITFTGAIYEENELAPWCLSARCFAYPAAIGLSVLHAFGYGLPVVTSDEITSHNPEIEALRPGGNGLLYEHDDAADFAAKIRQCCADRALHARLSAEALRTVTRPDGYTLDTMVRGFVDAIDFVGCCGGHDER